jgi:SAM-dependent methyltransferase
MYELHEAIEDRHWWFLGRRNIVRALLRRTLPAGARVLDVGCGTGGNLLAFARDYDIAGLDASPDAVARARRRSGRPVFEGRLPDALPALEPFDAVLLLDVLEHVEKDLDAARAVRTLLRPGGLLLVTVPALPLLWSGHDVIFQHLRRYRRPELSHLLESAGYQLQTLTFYNSLLFPPILAARLWKRATGDHAPRSDFRMPAPPINHALTRVFSAESTLLGRIPLPIGASLLATAVL